MAPGVKPLICSAPLCNFQYEEIGVGMSVIAEIKRDPAVADLLVSVFSAAVGTQFLTPAPPNYNQAEAEQILANLPAMTELVSKYQDDKALSATISPAGVRLLRWILCSNRSHLMSLPPAQRLAQFPSQHQFMAILSSPEKEDVFNALKARVGSMYLWHGSGSSRWHSIIRNGLKNATGTALMACGAALGPGIYLARDAATSCGYSGAGANKYAKSIYGASLRVLSLCEIAKVSATEQTITLARGSGGQVVCNGFLKDHGWAHTLTMEDACVVRFLMVGQENFTADVVASPPNPVPTLKDVLDSQAKSVH
jgi:poly [ADP-ribose] polymerase 6/8